MNVFIRRAILNDPGTITNIKQQGSRIALIADSNTAKLAEPLLSALNAELFIIPAGEKSKTRDTKKILEDQLLEKNYGRDSVIVAFGGGVVTDLAGFLAATYCRGLPLILIPTSLLSMVDASIGGKTGVNTSFGKNLIGAFYQPKAIYIDPDLLSSLPEKEKLSGLVEMLKHALISDSALLKELAEKSLEKEFLEEMITRSCQIKLNIVYQDEKESGLRQLLNFGHTIGHAIETAENFRIGHGEAVAIGILVESYLSQKMNYLSKEEFEQIHQVFKKCKIPLKLGEDFSLMAFKRALLHDKKAIGKEIRFVLLDAIGKPHIEAGQYSRGIPQTLYEEAIEWMIQTFQKPN